MALDHIVQGVDVFGAVLSAPFHADDINHVLFREVDRWAIVSEFVGNCKRAHGFLSASLRRQSNDGIRTTCCNFDKTG
jgi:hypothetical protein